MSGTGHIQRNEAGLKIMAKRLCCIILLTVLLAALLFTGGDAFFPHTPLPIEKYAAELAPFRIVYRNAALIVQAACIASHEDADEQGGAFCDYEITFVYAGKAGVNDIIHVRGSGKEGTEKLLYLIPEENADQNEIQYYQLCENGEFSINGDMIILSSGVLLPAEVLKADIRAQQKIKRIPSQYMYYSRFDPLVRDCDEILIVRAQSVSEYVITKCRSSVKGESVEKNCPVAEAEFTVLNGLASSRVYGEKLTVTLVGEMRDYVIDNENLTAVPKQDVKALEPGGIYLLFINHGEDAKEENYFLINPYQGYLRIEGDELHNCAINAALDGIRTLKAFTDRLYDSLAESENADADAPPVNGTSEDKAPGNDTSAEIPAENDTAADIPAENDTAADIPADENGAENGAENSGAEGA